MADRSNSTAASEFPWSAHSQNEHTPAGTALAERGPVASRRKAMCMSVAALIPSFGKMAEETREREMWLSLYREEREAAAVALQATRAREAAEFEARSRRKSGEDSPSPLECERSLADLRAHDAAAHDRWYAAEQAIVDAPATSMMGVAVKLALWVASGHGLAALTDPEDFDTPELALVSAWRSAVTLAGLPEEFGTEDHVANLALTQRS